MRSHRLVAVETLASTTSREPIKFAPIENRTKLVQNRPQLILPWSCFFLTLEPRISTASCLNKQTTESKMLGSY